MAAYIPNEPDSLSEDTKKKLFLWVFVCARKIIDLRLGDVYRFLLRPLFLI